MYKHVVLPNNGDKVTYDNNGNCIFPDNIIIPYIEGDGIGIDIMPVMKNVINNLVKYVYSNKRCIHWMEIYAGNKAKALYNSYFPNETLDIIKDFKVIIKGPMTTPISGGIRSLNVFLRQKLDLYICMRPVKYFGVPSCMKKPELLDLIIFRENSEDIYSGIEWKDKSKEAKKLINFLQSDLGVTNIRFPNTSSIGIKNISEEGTKRLVKYAIEYSIENKRSSITFVHKGNIMKYTEGFFKKWAYEVAINDFNAKLNNEGFLFIDNGSNKIIIKDVLSDAFFQQMLLRPKEYDVIVTMNLNGDYISDAAAAQVGGIGIAPGANIGNRIGVFEATHGTAPKYAGKNLVNPSSLILSAEMMLRYIGWNRAADIMIEALKNTIKEGYLTYDFARLDKNIKQVSCSKFGDLIINNIMKLI